MVAFACVFSRARGRGVRRRDEKEDGRTKREKDEGSPGHRGQKQEEEMLFWNTRGAQQMGVASLLG